MNRTLNKKILDEVNRARAWVHAAKQHPIWAKRCEQDATVQTLEGPVLARAGEFLCRGEAGEAWPQPAASLRRKYRLTKVVDARGWRMCLPKRGAGGVLAAKVAHPFSVRSRRGRLSGKAGDYLVKRYEDRDVEYPEDVWIVDQKLFAASYQIIARWPP